MQFIYPDENQQIIYPVLTGGGVTSLNGQTGALTLVAGTGITITPGAGTLTVAATGGGSTTVKIEMRTISAPEAAAKALTLVQTPANAGEISLDVVSGCSQFYGTDYTVSGSTLSWTGLGLDGLLAAGDRIVITYVY